MRFGFPSLFILLTLKAAFCNLSEPNTLLEPTIARVAVKAYHRAHEPVLGFVLSPRVLKHLNVGLKDSLMLSPSLRRNKPPSVVMYKDSKGSKIGVRGTSQSGHDSLGVYVTKEIEEFLSLKSGDYVILLPFGDGRIRMLRLDFNRF